MALPVFGRILDVSQYYCGADKNSALYSNRTPRSNGKVDGEENSVLKMERTGIVSNQVKLILTYSVEKLSDK